ncbi:histidine kinase [Pedobacter gandavensis]|uniref:sensor histidine kinase n=1 Tax=Pedobacter gandavensis TaxID=2679963 RepID=UPI00247A0914|nr:histidine kinase [Pedobacter gandavensis]WGQ07914.1 histidine kinase [Pedobacter gandavensis]
MRTLIITIFFLFSQIYCHAQKLEMNLDSISPILKKDKNGDSIRKYFSNAFYSREATFIKQNNLLISAFFSNKLAVNYQHAPMKIPQLKTYSNISSRVYMQAFDSYSGKYAVPIFDSTGIIVTVNGINPENAQLYDFRVLENNKKVVLPWTKVKLFVDSYWMTKIADSSKIDKVTAYLGQFKADYGKALTFQVRQTNLPDSINTSLSAYWVKWKPRVVGVFTFSQLPDFLLTFKKQWGDPRETKDNTDWSKDSTLLKLKKEFHYNENNLIFYLDDIIKSKNIIEYNLVKGKDSTGWTVNDFDFNLVWLKNLSPGKYDLKIRYSVQRMNVCSYPFTIQAAWYQTLWAKIGLSILALLAIGFILLLWRSKKQAEQLKAQGTLKQMVQTELKSIRSQFNPHFVFNALSSIQGLITKNDSENASKYLIEFSSLMRDSLKASTNEFVSISTEIKILENYLNLEKLRFGFNYQIESTAQIDTHAIEIPSLFLQPLVENAVKHGISSLQENGKLSVSFEKADNDMLVLVTDNGKGFNEQDVFNGFGLQLTKERIKLLNQTLNDQHIEFSMKRINNNTQIMITFKNWLI